ncbi:MAG: hypothetical protein L0212_06875 [Acidobacteria bacterium]|nr:hypothetical protein [Acidobacteriota bacterium]
MIFIFYIAVKVAAYIAWCWAGLAWLNPQRPGSRRWSAVKLGLLRFALGLFFGFVIFIGVQMVYQTVHSSVPTYLVVYVPVRWVEWSIIGLLLEARSPSLRSFVFSSGRKSALWRLGGIVLSCLADIPIMAEIGGLPVGRFFC